MSYMFYHCNSLESLPNFSDWDTKNVTNMSCIFWHCNSLKSLPDISNWDTKKVNNMSCLFCGCESLTSLPDILFGIQKVLIIWIGCLVVVNR